VANVSGNNQCPDQKDPTRYREFLYGWPEEENMVMAKDLKVRIDRLETMRAAHIHVLSETPEEDAWKKMELCAKPKGLLEKDIWTRVFGRNTYPTDATAWL